MNESSNGMRAYGSCSEKLVRHHHSAEGRIRLLLKLGFQFIIIFRPRGELLQLEELLEVHEADLAEVLHHQLRRGELIHGAVVGHDDTLHASLVCSLDRGVGAANHNAAQGRPTDELSSVQVGLRVRPAVLAVASCDDRSKAVIHAHHLEGGQHPVLWIRTDKRHGDIILDAGVHQLQDSWHHRRLAVRQDFPVDLLLPLRNPAYFHGVPRPVEEVLDDLLSFHALRPLKHPLKRRCLSLLLCHCEPGVEVCLPCALHDNAFKLKDDAHPSCAEPLVPLQWVCQGRVVGHVFHSLRKLL
mmetsp:Transcript_3741/g.10777  ORF Transcript_3741/g.10777 Transcript_3741/m.10777 type:complete len:299 (-) Transcript_3741:760-1656(-)